MPIPKRRTLTAVPARTGEKLEARSTTRTAIAEAVDAAPARAETIRYTAYLPRPVYRQLKELAFTHDGKMHDFVLQGLDLVFREHGLRSIQDLTAQDRKGARR